ncbi:GNAT family N-acetyltransferase [Trichocoleus sp. Lan]|uniref:GNAT family N-acetyltransferase n=1 Tax=Trichocoleus sp. Lan TaxID=2933927 RepID=UPI00329A0821
MDISEYILPTPWDSKVFGFDTFEIVSKSEEIFNSVFKVLQPGHYTVKVNPLFSKKILHEYGFYYCDTLIEPYCNRNSFVEYVKAGIQISKLVSIDDLIKISHGAFIHGRFHKDFNLDRNLADLRYDLWLKEIYNSQNVFGLMSDGQIAGFWGCVENKIVLHALSEEYRGRGMAKYFWSAACQEVFSQKYQELTSSISASNISVLNLYSSLGFKFRNPVDVYHILVK